MQCLAETHDYLVDDKPSHVHLLESLNGTLVVVCYSSLYDVVGSAILS